MALFILLLLISSYLANGLCVCLLAHEENHGDSYTYILHFCTLRLQYTLYTQKYYEDEDDYENEDKYDDKDNNNLDNNDNNNDYDNYNKTNYKNKNYAKLVVL